MKLTDEQNQVLLAAVDLVNGNQDMEEALGCYAVISRYVANQSQPAFKRPTDRELEELYDWMSAEWAANHEFEMPIAQYARAVLAKYEIEAGVN